MAMQVSAEQIDTSEMGTKDAGQKFIPNKNLFLSMLGGWLINHNATFTGLTMKIYSNRSNDLGKLIATSTSSYANTDITTESYGWKWVYFEFSDIPLKNGETYWAVLDADTYTGTDDNHIAWSKDWPKAINTTNATETALDSVKASLELSSITSEI